VRFQDLGPQPSLATLRCSSHRLGKGVLDKAFALIEGHPTLWGMKEWASRPSHLMYGGITDSGAS
jgi:hypothetical protein